MHFLHELFNKQLRLAPEIPCTACGWTSEKQSYCSYFSHVKLIEGASDQGIWTLGSKFILSERGSDPPNVAARNLRFIKENTSIPVPTIIAEWEEDNGRYFTIEERMPGKELQEVWSTLNENDKKKIAKQTADYAQQLRALQSDSIQSLGGEGAYSDWLFGGSPSSPHGPLSSDGELWEELNSGLKESGAVRDRLRERMPPSKPYTFTHGFLSTFTVMVENGNVTGILGWEGSGYFPCWWEGTKSRVGVTIEDMEFKSFLWQYMPGNKEAYEFWADIRALREDDDSCERRKQLLKDAY
ncbi:hypothetical protein FQN54_007947 [Arachnomyces sp. PD_36]|nr:hypothetical protein FQN54_007947 [Arachnomyces sp. PD_36]